MKFAYALVEDPARPGKLFSIELESPTYKLIRHLEPGSRSESLGAATERLCTEVQLRGRRRAW